MNYLWRAWCTKGEDEDIIAVKIFGASGDAMLDREKGKQLIEALHKQGINAPVHAMYVSPQRTRDLFCKISGVSKYCLL